MASITQSGGSSQWYGANSTSYTLASYSAPAGSKRVLMIAILLQNNAATDFTISSVTFDGNTCTSVVEQTNTSSGRWYRSAIFYYILGNSGSATVGDIVVTSGTQLEGATIYAVTLANVDQSSPVWYSNSNTNIPTGIGLTSGARDGSYAFACVQASAGSTYTWTSTAGTEVFETGPGSSDSAELCAAGYYSILEPDAAITFTMTKATNPPASVGVAAKFQPALSGTTHSGTSTDGMKGSESLLRRATYRRLSADGGKGSDTPSRRAIYRRLSSDGARGGDSRSRQAMMRAIGIDAAIISDALSRMTRSGRAASDGARLADALAVRGLLLGSAIDGAKLSDALASVLAMAVTTSDGLKVSDLSAADVASALQATASELLKVGDTSSALHHALVAVTDGARVAESVTAIGRFVKLVADAVRASDTPQRQIETAAAAVEALLASDNSVAAKIAAAIVADILLMADSASSGGAITAQIIESMLLGDSGSASVTYDVTVSDAAEMSEAIARTMTFLAAVTDGYKLGDVTLHLLPYGIVKVSMSTRHGGSISFQISTGRIDLTVHRGE